MCIIKEKPQSKRFGVLGLRNQDIKQLPAKQVLLVDQEANQQLLGLVLPHGTT
jgi:hypothetical protein